MDAVKIWNLRLRLQTVPELYGACDKLVSLHWRFAFTLTLTFTTYVDFYTHTTCITRAVCTGRVSEWPTPLEGFTHT